MNINPPNGIGSPFTDPKHGTTTVAAKFKGGVVVATDRRASMGTFVASNRAKKLHQINDKTVATIAGLVADAQYLVDLLRANLNLYELNRGYAPTTKMVGNLLSSIMYEQFRSYFPYFVHMLICGIDNEGPHAYFIESAGSISDEEFVSTGSGSFFAYGVLEALWKKDMTEEQAVEVVIKAISSSLKRDTATGDSIDLCVVTNKGVKFLKDEEIKQKGGAI